MVETRRKSIKKSSKKSINHPSVKPLGAKEGVASAAMSEVDPSGNFLFVSKGQGWKVFDVVSMSSVMESLEDHVTCFTWKIVSMPVEKSPAPKKKKKSSTSSSVKGKDVVLLALGTKSGNIMVYDFSSMMLIRSFKEHSEEISAICWSIDKSSSLVAVDGGNKISFWDVSKGEMMESCILPSDQLARKVSAISLLDDSKLALAAGDIRIFNMMQKEFLDIKFVAHDGVVDQLKRLGNGLFLSKSKEDNFVYVWDQNSSEPVKVIRLESPCSKIDARADNSGVFLCLDVEGLCSIWSTDSDAKQIASFLFQCVKTKSRIPLITARIADDKYQGDKLNVASFRGSDLMPEFELLNIDQSSTTVILERSFSSNLLTLAKAETQILDKKKKALKYSEHDATISSATESQIGDGTSNTSDIAMADRLKALGIMEDSTSTSDAVAGSGLKKKSLPKSDSICAMLNQAIHTNDSSLLEQVLAVTDRKLIENTVEKLNTTFLIPFLNQIVCRMQTKYKRGVSLYCWIRAILKIHSSTLMTIPNLSKVIRPLYKTVESRTAHYKSFLEISGRLDLVVEHIHSENRKAKNRSQEAEETFVYHEGDEEEMEIESLSDSEEEMEDLDMNSDEDLDEDSDEDLSD